MLAANYPHTPGSGEPLNRVWLYSDFTKAKYRESNVRWIVLVFACLTCVGSYFIGNLLQVFQENLIADLNLDLAEFNAVFSISSLPNLVLPLVGGIIIDRLGLRLGYSIFSTLVVLGQCLTTYGVSNLSFTEIKMGRFISSLGSDTLIVAKTVIITKWFMGKELSVSLGLGLCAARIGSIMCNFLAPRVFTYTGDLSSAFYLGTLLCIISMISAFIANHYDEKADRLDADPTESARPKDLAQLRDVKTFSGLYWLLILSSCFLYVSFFGFTNNLNAFMQDRFGLSVVQAGDLSIIIYAFPVIMTPIFGFLADLKGKRVIMILAACVIYFLDHLFMAALPDSTAGNPSYTIAWGLIAAGLFYSIYAAVFWPCLSLVVLEKLTGVAYGIAFSCQNIILVVLPIVIGHIHDNTLDVKSGYYWTEIALAGLVACGTLVTVPVYFLDKRMGGQLDRPGTERLDSLVSTPRSETIDFGL